MEGFDRRKFLKGSSVAAGLAGAITVVPGAIPALAKSAANRPSPTRGSDAGYATEIPSHSDPVVLHVRDAKSGRIDVFVGQQHLSVNDRALARRIMSAVS